MDKKENKEKLKKVLMDDLFNTFYMAIDEIKKLRIGVIERDLENIYTRPFRNSFEKLKELGKLKNE